MVVVVLLPSGTVLLVDELLLLTRLSTYYLPWIVDLVVDGVVLVRALQHRRWVPRASLALVLSGVALSLAPPLLLRHHVLRVVHLRGVEEQLLLLHHVRRRVVDDLLRRHRHWLRLVLQDLLLRRDPLVELPAHSDLRLLELLLLRLRLLRKAPIQLLLPWKDWVAHWLLNRRIVLHWRRLELRSKWCTEYGVRILLLHHELLLLQLLLLEQELLLLLEHECLLRLLAEDEFVLLVDELEELLARHGQDLVEAPEHEALEVLVGDAQDRRPVRLVLRVVEHEVRPAAETRRRVRLQVLRHRRRLRVQDLRRTRPYSVFLRVARRRRLLTQRVLARLVRRYPLLLSYWLVMSSEYFPGDERVFHRHNRRPSRVSIDPEHALEEVDERVHGVDFAV